MIAKLEPEFMPMVKVINDFKEAVPKAESQSLAICVERNGGTILLENANEVLKTEFPELYKKIKLHIPDEKARRVGQSVAAASLPRIG